MIRTIVSVVLLQPRLPTTMFGTVLPSNTDEGKKEALLLPMDEARRGNEVQLFALLPVVVLNPHGSWT